MSSNRTVGVLPVVSLLMGASLWGVIWYPLRELERGGLQGVWLTLILYAAALVFSLPRTARAFPEFLRNPRDLSILLLAAGWTNVAFVLAILDGNILRVLLLFYLSPLWAVTMGWLILKERMSRAAFMSLLFAMIGALIMLWNQEVGFPWPHSHADWLALSAGFAFALSNVLVRKTQEVSVACKSAVVWVGVVVVALAMIALFDLPLPQAGMHMYAAAVLLGVAGILAMTVLVQYGVSYMPVHRSAVIALVEIVAGALSQQLLTSEVVTWLEWGGGVLIVLGAYWSARASVVKAI
jgi:drug/metabolite transporter (DMT)-like permease